MVRFLADRTFQLRCGQEREERLMQTVEDLEAKLEALESGKSGRSKRPSLGKTEETSDFSQGNHTVSWIFFSKMFSTFSLLSRIRFECLSASCFCLAAPGTSHYTATVGTKLREASIDTAWRARRDSFSWASRHICPEHLPRAPNIWGVQYVFNLSCDRIRVNGEFRFQHPWFAFDKSVGYF